MSSFGRITCFQCGQYLQGRFCEGCGLPPLRCNCRHPWDRVPIPREREEPLSDQERYRL